MTSHHAGEVPCGRLTGGQIRDQRFPVGSLPAGGLDPRQVYAFLEKVAADADARRRDIAVLAAENIRLRNIIRNQRVEAERAPDHGRPDRQPQRWPAANAAFSGHGWPAVNVQ